MLSSLLEGGAMFAPKLEFSFSSVLYLELFKMHHCLPDPGGKCCRSVFHTAASAIQFLHFVAPPTLKTFLCSERKNLVWRFLVGFSTSDPQLCGFLRTTL